MAHLQTKDVASSLQPCPLCTQSPPSTFLGSRSNIKGLGCTLKPDVYSYYGISTPGLFCISHVHAIRAIGKYKDCAAMFIPGHVQLAMMELDIFAIVLASNCAV